MEVEHDPGKAIPIQEMKARSMSPKEHEAYVLGAKFMRQEALDYLHKEFMNPDLQREDPEYQYHLAMAKRLSLHLRKVPM